MLRWQEEYERTQAEFMRTIRSFKTTSQLWAKLAIMNSDNLGRAIYARKVSVIYARMERDAKARFSAVGYKHRVDAMDLEKMPLLSTLLEKDQQCLEDPSVTVDSCLQFALPQQY